MPCSLQYALSCWALPWVLILGHIPLRHKLSTSLGKPTKTYSTWKSPNDTLYILQIFLLFSLLRFCSNVLHIIFSPQLFLDSLRRRHFIWDLASSSFWLIWDLGTYFNLVTTKHLSLFLYSIEQHLHPLDSLFLRDVYWNFKVLYSMSPLSIHSIISQVFLLTPWTAAYQAPPSMGFSRQEYWSGEPLSSLLWWFSGKEFAGNAGDQSSIPASGRSSGEGSKNPLQYSCLGNPTDRKACHKRVGHDWGTQQDTLYSKRSLFFSFNFDIHQPPIGGVTIESQQWKVTVRLYEIIKFRATWDQ